VPGVERSEPPDWRRSGGSPLVAGGATPATPEFGEEPKYYWVQQIVNTRRDRDTSPAVKRRADHVNCFLLPLMSCVPVAAERRPGWPPTGHNPCPTSNETSCTYSDNIQRGRHPSYQRFRRMPTWRHRVLTSRRRSARWAERRVESRLAPCLNGAPNPLTGPRLGAETICASASDRGLRAAGGNLSDPSQP